MKTGDKNPIGLRIMVLAVLFGLFFAAIAARTVYLQIYRGPWLSAMAAGQYESSHEALGKRGNILDRNGVEMAVSINVTSLAAYPAHIADPQAAARSLSKILNIDRKKLIKNLTSGKAFVWIKRQATPRETDRIRALNLDGIGFIPEYNRFYPNKTLAAQTIGFTGIDGKGLEGIEYHYDKYLKGASRRQIIERDALGYRIKPPQGAMSDFSGYNLTLTIDRTIQYIVEKALADGIERYSAKSGIAIVMQPSTGAILALANYPFFNPNTFGTYDPAVRRNRAITDSLEPGSTMKIFSAAAAIESGGSSPSTIFYCENGAYRIGKKTIHDLGKHGWLSLQQIIKYSSNIGAIKISEMVGPERLHRTLRNFGFGTRAGIDVSGETAGRLYHYSRWTRMDASAISFGHGIAVSPIQLITAVSAIANKGILMRPCLVRAIDDSNGSRIYTFAPQKVRQAISAETAETVGEIMKTVIARGGTGVRAALESYSVCGKTGTAKKITAEGTYAEGKYTASFIGYTPSEKPAISVLVIIDEPREKYYGGLVAAPVFRKIAHQTLNYLDIAPDLKPEQLAIAGQSEDKG